MDNTINVIYDSRYSPDDYGRLLEEFIVQGIVKYRFWDAVILKDSVVKSINASHKKIVQWAKDNKKPQVVIAEQDLTFPSPNSWNYFLEQQPSQFDLWLWGSYILPPSNKKICGFQLYIIREQYYDKFLSAPEEQHIDTAICDMGGDFHFCYPFPALQRVGFSANNPGEPVNYNSMLQPQDIYKG